MAGESLLDDAFAAFLSEVAPDLAAEPAAKRPRGGPGLQESVAEGRKERAERAEALRKAAFQASASNVSKLLDGLSSPADRLLLVDAADEEDGYTALHLAAICGSLEVCKALLQRRADTDVSSHSGDTPLMWAAHRGDMAMCKELLRAGADAARKNQRGRTAASQAHAGGHRRVKEMLENHLFDRASRLQPRATAAAEAAAARRAANAAMVARAVAEQKERDEEEAFWAGVRARAAEREAQEKRDEPATDDGRALGGGASRQKADFEAEPAPEQVSLRDLPVQVREHYKTLNAPADATEVEVRTLYRKLALAHHPDKNPKDPAGAKERFTRVAVAYEAVCDFLASGGPEGVGGVRIAPPAY